MLPRIKPTLKFLIALSLLGTLLTFGYMSLPSLVSKLTAKQASVEGGGNRAIYWRPTEQNNVSSATKQSASATARVSNVQKILPGIVLPEQRTVQIATEHSISTQQNISTVIPTTKHTTSKPSGVWSKLNISTLTETPDPQCSDVICSNFASQLSCAKFGSSKIRKGSSVIPTCHFQDPTTNHKYLLRSYPGSGNTWVRSVLEKVTGICTGSIYCDHEIWLSGMIGEGLTSPSVLVVKTHVPNTPGHGTIFIVRNPFDAIVSYWKWYLVAHLIYRKEKGMHVVSPPVEYFREDSRWNKMIKEQAKKWVGLIKYQLNTAKEPVLIVTYEDLKSNITREVLRMLDFLHVSYSEEKVVSILKTDMTEFKRPKKDFDPYTPPQREVVRTQVQEFVNSLRHEAMLKIVNNYLSDI